MPDRIEVQSMVEYYAQQLLTRGHDVDTGHWQSLKDVPQTRTRELRNTCFVMPIPPVVKELQELVQPNMPWAEDHFLERVGGEPLNPGEQYKNWPWYRGNVDQHLKIKESLDERRFSHTYMERYWPKYAATRKGPWGSDGLHQGIRYSYGDLNDLVDLLVREPYTRQAYLPVWFPEDTGAVDHQRVPCSLGYHFLFRGEELHINYFIRSCDLLRHFADDVYLTARLCQWVVDEWRKRTFAKDDPLAIIPGTLTMFMSSLHVFEGDLPRLRREYGA